MQWPSSGFPVFFVPMHMGVCEFCAASSPVWVHGPPPPHHYQDAKRFQPHKGPFFLLLWPHPSQPRLPHCKPLACTELFFISEMCHFQCYVRGMINYGIFWHWLFFLLFTIVLNVLPVTADQLLMTTSVLWHRWTTVCISVHLWEVFWADFGFWLL